MLEIKTLLRTSAWLLGVIVLAGILLFQLVDPAPPKHLVIAAGEPEGRYFQAAEALKNDLQKQGVDVEIIVTAGSSENIAKLLDPTSNVVIAFVQSGVEELTQDKGGPLYSLGSLFYEPMWLFYRKELNIRFLSELKGKRIAIGRKGSGTQTITQFVLSENGVRDGNQGTQMFEGDIDTTIEQLRDGSIDAAFFTISPQSNTIKKLLEIPSIDFVDVQRHNAYTARYPFLSSVVISQGLLNLEHNIPDSDRTTLASTATLVVNERFHPALTPLVLQSFARQLRSGGMLEAPQAFPSADNTGFELTPEAEHFYKHGPPFLQRYLPFWAASLVDRLTILVIPLLVILIPLSKMAGPLYRWRIRSRIYKWYRDLLAVDRNISFGQADDIARQQQKLSALSDEIGSIDVPLSYADELYQLKQHVEYIDRKLNRLLNTKS